MWKTVFGILLLASLAYSSEWIVTGGETTLDLYDNLIEDLGLDLVNITTSAEPLRGHGIAFRAEPHPSLVFDAEHADFEGLGNGSLRHQGGFDLLGGNLSLQQFELRTTSAPYDLVLTDSSGTEWFWVNHAHPYLLPERSELLMLQMDLIIADQLARQLGHDDLSGMTLGSIELVLQVLVPADFEPGRGACTADFSGTVDVELTSIGTTSQNVRDGGQVALTASASLSNAGTADVRWFRSIAPDGNVGPQFIGQHPFLTLHFYRIHNGVIEQLGRSDVKHAFYSVNSGCSCSGGQVLYVGCGDTYGSSTNVNRHYLAPREELTASTGTWQSLGSHFDATPVDDFRHHGSSNHTNPFTHKLVVNEADLGEPTAKYYMEMWYLVQGDVDIFNSMGHRLAQPSFNGSSWTFSSPNPKIAGPTIDAWVDPDSPTANSLNTTIEANGGHLKLAVLVTTPTESGGSMYQYEYALMNLDYDLQIDSFTVPLVENTAVSNAGSGRPGSPGPSDWTPTVTATQITWNAPSGSELDWGELVNFRFQSPREPQEISASLGVFEAGTPSSLSAPTRTPTACVIQADIEAAVATWPVANVLEIITLQSQLCD